MNSAMIDEEAALDKLAGQVIAENEKNKQLRDPTISVFEEHFQNAVSACGTEAKYKLAVSSPIVVEALRNLVHDGFVETDNGNHDFLEVWNAVYTELNRHTFAVRAVIKSGDHLLSTEFNAVDWLNQVSEEDLISLEKSGWADNYQMDKIARFSSGVHNQIEKIYDYSQSLADSANSDVAETECWVDPIEAIAWLMRYRQQVGLKLSRDSLLIEPKGLVQWVGLHYARDYEDATPNQRKLWVDKYFVEKMGNGAQFQYSDPVMQVADEAGLAFGKIAPRVAVEHVVNTRAGELPIMPQIQYVPKSMIDRAGGVFAHAFARLTGFTGAEVIHYATENLVDSNGDEFNMQAVMDFVEKHRDYVAIANDLSSDEAIVSTAMLLLDRMMEHAPGMAVVSPGVLKNVIFCLVAVPVRDRQKLIYGAVMSKVDLVEAKALALAGGFEIEENPDGNGKFVWWHADSATQSTDFRTMDLALEECGDMVLNRVLEANAMTMEVWTGMELEDKLALVRVEYVVPMPDSHDGDEASATSLKM